MLSEEFCLRKPLNRRAVFLSETQGQLREHKSKDS